MKNRNSKTKPRSRQGLTIVLAALLIVLMLSMVAFAVDLGYIMLVRTQLQVAADSAAMSAASVNMDRSFQNTVAAAKQYADRHRAGGKYVELDTADVELGAWDFRGRIFTPSRRTGNAVRVTARRDSTTGGEAGLFFAKLLGSNSCALKAEATAAFIENFTGFHPPSSGGNLPILPLALSKSTWNALRTGVGTDYWTWDAESETVTPGPDGAVEVSLYPHRVGAPGNWGAVDIGRRGNGAAALARQILRGVSPEDLSYHGGSLELDAHGQLTLGADPGLSGGIKDELEAIRGQPRIIPIYDQVLGRGNNAKYRIVQFAGVRIVDVEFRGPLKRVMIQRAVVVVRGGIPARGDTRTSYSIFSPVSLVR